MYARVLDTKKGALLRHLLNIVSKLFLVFPEIVLHDKQIILDPLGFKKDILTHFIIS